MFFWTSLQIVILAVIVIVYLSYKNELSQIRDEIARERHFQTAENERLRRDLQTEMDRDRNRRDREQQKIDNRLDDMKDILSVTLASLKSVKEIESKIADIEKLKTEVRALASDVKNMEQKTDRREIKLEYLTEDVHEMSKKLMQVRDGLLEIGKHFRKLRADIEKFETEDEPNIHYQHTENHYHGDFKYHRGHNVDGETSIGRSIAKVIMAGASYVITSAFGTAASVVSGLGILLLT